MAKQLIHLFKSFSLFLILQSTLLFGQPSEDHGCLIISYQTGQKAERLDRIRFVLINDKQEQHMYPKKEDFVDDPSGLMRMVIIDNLEPGNYQLKFVIPNCDGLLEEVPPRTFTIEKGKTIKIDQAIPVRAVTK